MPRRIAVLAAASVVTMMYKILRAPALTAAAVPMKWKRTETGPGWEQKFMAPGVSTQITWHVNVATQIAQIRVAENDSRRVEK